MSFQGVPGATTVSLGLVLPRETKSLACFEQFQSAAILNPCSD